MLCTVSTVKDSRANVEHFVAGNLASGADHLFVFLEGDEDGTHDLLRGHPHVTVVATDDRYWGGRRPDELIQRQMVNANLVNCLVSAFPDVEWLVHLDGDECLDVNKTQLAALDPGVRCVRLAVLEAVSTEHGTRDAKYFKRKLREDQLQMLVDLGVIEAAHNRYYLFGHLLGKAAVRPGLDVDMGIHRATSKTGADLEHLKGPGFRVLHYDSVSMDEFVRKWTSHLNGGATKFREERQAVLREVAAVLADAGADEAQRAAELRKIYKRRIEDPVDLLRRHKLLVVPPKERHSYRPTPFPAEQRRELDRLVQRLLAVDKERLLSKGPQNSAVDLMREIGEGLAGEEPLLADRVRQAVQRGCGNLRASHAPPSVGR